MHECARCNESIAEGGFITSGGICYSLCKLCFDIVESSPTGTLESFMGAKKERWVAKNMREARERRAKGHFLWH